MVQKSVSPLPYAVGGQQFNRRLAKRLVERAAEYRGHGWQCVGGRGRFPPLGRGLAVAAGFSDLGGGILGGRDCIVDHVAERGTERLAGGEEDVTVVRALRERVPNVVNVFGQPLWKMIWRRRWG